MLFSRNSLLSHFFPIPMNSTDFYPCPKVCTKDTNECGQARNPFENCEFPGCPRECALDGKWPLCFLSLDGTLLLLSISSNFLLFSLCFILQLKYAPTERHSREILCEIVSWCDLVSYSLYVAVPISIFTPTLHLIIGPQLLFFWLISQADFPFVLLTRARGMFSSVPTEHLLREIQKIMWVESGNTGKILIVGILFHF